MPTYQLSANCKQGDFPLKISTNRAFISGYAEDLTLDFVVKKIQRVYGIRATEVTSVYFVEFDDQGNPCHLHDIKYFE